MLTKKRYCTPLLFLCILVYSYGCKKKPVDDDTTPAPSYIYLTFNFAHQVDGAAVNFDTLQYVNANNDTFSIINLRYFISNIVLHKGTDSVLIDLAHYVDIRDNSTLKFVPAVPVPNGHYDSISFIFGLGPDKNVNGYFVNPPEVNMVWPNPMGGGYHYMQLEGKFDSAGTVKNYAAHTGALMGVDSHIRIHLAQSAFTVNSNRLSVNLLMNINEWFKNPNLYDFNVYGDAVMGNHTAQTILKQNGADVFTVTSIQ